MKKQRKLIAKNPLWILKIINNRLGLKYTYYWHEKHENHPEFPSLISFSHIFHKQGIDNIIFESSIEELSALPMPIIVHTSLNNGVNLVIDGIDENNIYIINETYEREAIDIKLFDKAWDRYILVINLKNYLDKKSRRVLNVR